MPRLRQVLTMMALLVLGGISVASALHVARRGLHEPALDPHADLLNMLSTRDLAHEPNDMKLRLVRRLEPEFLRGVAWRNRIEALDDESWDRMQDNFVELTRLWLVEKAENYHALATDEEREGYFNGEAKHLMTWGAASWSSRERGLQPENIRSSRRSLTRAKNLAVPGMLENLSWDSPDELDRVRSFLQDAFAHFAQMMERRRGGAMFNRNREPAF